MPPISIAVNIDLVKKDKFYQGKKGRYLDLILIETPESEYGDYLVKQRGERDEKLPILGNGKYFAPKGKKQPKGAADRNETNGQPDDGDPW